MESLTQPVPTESEDQSRGRCRRGFLAGIVLGTLVAGAVLQHATRRGPIYTAKNAAKRRAWPAAPKDGGTRPR